MNKTKNQIISVAFVLRFHHFSVYGDESLSQWVVNSVFFRERKQIEFVRQKSYWFSFDKWDVNIFSRTGSNSIVELTRRRISITEDGPIRKRKLEFRRFFFLCLCPFSFRFFCFFVFSVFNGKNPKCCLHETIEGAGKYERKTIDTTLLSLCFRC